MSTTRTVPIDHWRACAFDAAFEALAAPSFVATREGSVLFTNRPGRAWLDADPSRIAAVRAAATSGDGPFRVSEVPLGEGRGDLRLLVHDPAAAPPSDPAHLTARERDVLELLAHGATYDDIARMLAITTNTVRTHVRSLYEKLHASSKTEAVRAAVALGYVALAKAG